MESYISTDLAPIAMRVSVVASCPKARAAAMCGDSSSSAVWAALLQARRSSRTRPGFDSHSLS